MLTVKASKMTAGGLIEKEYTFDTATDFGINEDNLDGEVCVISQNLCNYGEVYGLLKAQLAVHESDEDRLEAHYDLWFRDPTKFPIKAGEKLTEKKIKSLVASQPAMQQAVDKTNATKRDFYQVENLYRSLHRKVDMLEALSFRRNAELKATKW